MDQSEIGLGDLLDASAQSFHAAQQEAGLPKGLKSAMLISTAELAIKAGLRIAQGKLMIEPANAASVKRRVDSSALSTITIRYVAAQSDTSVADEPELAKDKVEEEVAVRPDIAKLQDILGKLTIKAHYVPDLHIWNVHVTDDRGRTVRLLTIEDKK